MQREYMLEVAETVAAMVADGIRDPSTKEIAERHMQRGVLGGEVEEGIGQRLKGIAKVLANDWGYQCCFLNYRYYMVTPRRPGGYRLVPPKNATEAELVVCGPSGMSPRGLWVSPDGAPDLLIEAYYGWSAKTTAGSIKSTASGMLTATERGAMLPETAAQMLSIGASSVDQARKLLGNGAAA